MSRPPLIDTVFNCLLSDAACYGERERSGSQQRQPHAAFRQDGRLPGSRSPAWCDRAATVVATSAGLTAANVTFSYVIEVPGHACVFLGGKECKRRRKGALWWCGATGELSRGYLA
jgi:hypothetical protein